MTGRETVRLVPMPILVNIQKVSAGDVELSGELPAEALEVAWDDTLLAGAPVDYALSVSKHDRGLSISGRLLTAVTCECVRCLRSFDHAVDLPRWRAYAPLQGEDKLDIVNDCVDLTPLVRDDILLHFPRHPACGQPDCVLPGGRDAHHGQDDPEQEKETGSPSVWAALDKLDL